MLIDPQPCAQPIEHLNDSGRALLGQQIDLQTEMIPTIGDHSHAILFHQHKRGEQDRLE